ncbi:MAG: formylglycine-generating enzyme family protein [Rhodospirillaceae bacterium]
MTKLGYCTALTALCLVFATTPQAQSPAPAFKDCETCPEMVVIPPGTFEMGSDFIDPMRAGEMRPRGPIRTVTISKPFAAGKYEVTVGEWRAFVADTGHQASDCRVWGGDRRRFGQTWEDPDYDRPIAENDPIVCVYWTEAQDYVNWLSEQTGERYRLLSEAEWEYVARGGVDTKWFWGDDDSKVCEYGNVLDQTAAADPGLIAGSGTSMDMAAPCADGYAMVAAVGQFKPNVYGVHDTIGNVWEWTQDCSPVLYPDQPVDGSAYEVEGACEKRAIRSGSWRSRLLRQERSFRGRDPEPTSYHLFGFRVARDLE